VKNFVRRIAGSLLQAALRSRSRAYVPPVGPVLVVAPHADDETLGCGGLITALTGRGTTVQVAFVSDSAGSPESSPPPGQAAQRRGEALAALGTLGVTPDLTTFLDAPDGRLDRLPPAELARVRAALAELLQRHRIADVFMPYRGGGSSEHDAVTGHTRAAVAASGSLCRVWEYPVWAWWDPRRLSGQLARPQENFSFPLGPLRERKRAALACHASQCVPQPPQSEPALPPVLAALCTGPTEFYFLRQP
jgi:LmbE family N-acetylglucosaminyl deacetylase